MSSKFKNIAYNMNNIIVECRNEWEVHNGAKGNGF